MAVDEENSIYVGGLPYDCSENTIRRAFELYGAIVAVKIINDHDIGGKCYGFVTFTNPRCAVDAISDMDGKKIDGRVVRVNEVKTRGGRPQFNRGNNHRDAQRNWDWDRDRDRDRDNDIGRERYRDRNSGRSRDCDPELEKEYDRPRGRNRFKDRFADEDRDLDRDRENIENEWIRKQDRDLGRNHELEWDRDRDLDRNNDHDRIENGKDKDKDQQSNDRTSLRVGDRRSRELSSNSSDDYHDQAKEQLELSIQKYEELQEEISQIQRKSDDKETYVSDLQKKSQILEDALATAKKHCSQRRMQLTKFQRCILQVNDYTAKLKSSEQELQSLVDTVMAEADDVEDAVLMDGPVYINGKA